MSESTTDWQAITIVRKKKKRDSKKREMEKKVSKIPTRKVTEWARKSENERRREKEREISLSKEKGR